MPVPGDFEKEPSTSARIHLKPSRDQLLRQNSRLPEDPTAGISISLPLTSRTSCLSSHPKSQDSEVRRAAAHTQPHKGLCKHRTGDRELPRGNIPGPRRPLWSQERPGPDTREASPDAALPRLRQRTGTLARPHSPLR